MKITRKEAQAAFGDNPRALAMFLGIDHTTVSHWAEDRPIPEAHQWRLACAFPLHFPRAHACMIEINAQRTQDAIDYLRSRGANRAAKRLKVAKC